MVTLGPQREVGGGGIRIARRPPAIMRQLWRWHIVRRSGKATERGNTPVDAGPRCEG